MGSGRDTYVKHKESNGIPNSPIPNKCFDLLSSLNNPTKPRNLRKIHYKVHYNPSGDGRDGYINTDHGGQFFCQKPDFNFKLRSSYDFTNILDIFKQNNETSRLNEIKMKRRNLMRGYPLSKVNLRQSIERLHTTNDESTYDQKNKKNDGLQKSATWVKNLRDYGSLSMKNVYDNGKKNIYANINHQRIKTLDAGKNENSDIFPQAKIIR